jgi:hypothetical protein
MINRFRFTTSRNLYNILGWHTNRKIVVIESDDWGSIRMPSKEVYEILLKSGIRVDNCPYNRYDSLASDEDLNVLFDILVKHKDKNGNYPVITANCLVANPDFDRIRESGFQEYHYELIPETLKKYPKHQKSFELWKEGLSQNIFFPQFHGREHVNIKFWLDRLIEGNKTFRKAFDLGLWGLGPNIVDGYKINIQASFDMEDPNDIEYQKLIIKDGLKIFYELFGYKSASFIANNFIWDSQLNSTLFENGVSILQGMKKQYLPVYNHKYHKSLSHSTGEYNALGQLYLMRNCFFEPSLIPDYDPVNFCLNDIQNAFLWHKPAIITSHRLNFIGGIIASNRDNNLKSFDCLLQEIIKRWPEVEFMTSVQLGDLIATERNKHS